LAIKMPALLTRSDAAKRLVYDLSWLRRVGARMLGDGAETTDNSVSKTEFATDWGALCDRLRSEQ
jgi:hypothetical protein